jgi:hypothetical protein
MIGASRRTALLARPERRGLREDPVAELVPGPGEREGGVRVEALEASGAARAADPERELRPQGLLVGVRPSEAPRESRLGLRGTGPALDAARRLEARDPGDELRAREPELRREGLAARVERRLLGDRRPAERTAGDDPQERTRRASELPLYELAVVQGTKCYRCA